MRRGDLATVAASRDHGKPRPALVVQADAFSALSSITVLQLTSEIHEEHLIRVSVVPSAENGLRKPSQVMVERVVSVPRAKVGPVFGHLDAGTAAAVDRALVRCLALQASGERWASRRLDR